MTIGAYTTVMLSKLAEAYGFVNSYFIFAIILAFIIAFIIGYFIEFALIRHLYKRPLDTLLATWGLSLVMQQIFRSSFGAKEVSAHLPEWLLGAFQITEMIEIPINGVFVLVLAFVVTAGVYLFMFKSRYGLQMRATVQNRGMAGAVGINTKKVDRMTYALGCGIAGIAGAAFTTIASTGPTSGSLYIVDSFMVVVFGGAGSLIGTIASAFGIAQAQSILQFFMSSSMGKVSTLLVIVVILMMKPEGLFASKLRK